jgi:hypothetical protein
MQQSLMMVTEPTNTVGAENGLQSILDMFDDRQAFTPAELRVARRRAAERAYLTLQGSLVGFLSLTVPWVASGLPVESLQWLPQTIIKTSDQQIQAALEESLVEAVVLVSPTGCDVPLH